MGGSAFVGPELARGLLGGRCVFRFPAFPLSRFPNFPVSRSPSFPIKASHARARALRKGITLIGVGPELARGWLGGLCVFRLPAFPLSQFSALLAGNVPEGVLRVIIIRNRREIIAACPGQFILRLQVLQDCPDAGFAPLP